MIAAIKAIGFALVLALWGCANVDTAVGGGAVAIKNIAQMIKRECGNTVPDGECQPLSRITTWEKDRLKQQLQVAQNHLEIAAQTNATAQSKATALEKADAILAAIEIALLERGIR